jgi:hypothetical protein
MSLPVSTRVRMRLVSPLVFGLLLLVSPPKQAIAAPAAGHDSAHTAHTKARPAYTKPAGYPKESPPGKCPGEGGCVFGKWTAKASVKVYRNRSTASPVAFQLGKGATVAGITSVQIVLEPGQCTVTAAGATADSPLERGKAVPLEKGKTFLIDDVSEGFVYGYLNGKLVEFCCRDQNITCSKWPKIELWLEVRNSDGLTGWTNEREKFNGTSQYD